MAGPNTSLVFTVRRCKPELVAPAKPTPHEFKQLSDLDEQVSFRHQTSIIQLYRYDALMQGKDPVKVIREALGQALVFYYPLAGRLREGPGRKLVVECTGEGILFIEADGDVTLKQFGDPPPSPFPCFEELLFDVPNSGGILNCPLLLIQVTRLKCGGFIFTLRLNHTMGDAIGLVQFIKVVGEIARGAPAPSIWPVWQRHHLKALEQPSMTSSHPKYEGAVDTKSIVFLDVMAQCSFFLRPSDVSALRRFLPPHCQCSTFEVVTACLWRCRTIALQPDRDEEVRVQWAINIRSKVNPPLPPGYYGNALAFTAAVTTAGKLCENSLGYALELVKKAKNDVMEEYMQSLTDLKLIKARPNFTLARLFVVADLSRVGFGEVDFGWGKPACIGVPEVEGGRSRGVLSYYLPFKNSKGEDGVLIPIALPAPAMERFVKELDRFLSMDPIGAQQSSVSRL